MNKKILVGLLLAVLALGGGAYYYFGSSTGDLQGMFGSWGGSGTGSASSEKPCKSPKEVLMSELIELLEEDLGLDAGTYDLKAPITEVLDGTKLKDLSEEEVDTLADDIIAAVLAMLEEEGESGTTVSDDGKDLLVELLQKHIDELNAKIASGTGTTSSSSSSGSTGSKSMPCGPSTKVKAEETTSEETTETEETATSDEEAGSSEETTETDDEEVITTEDTDETTTDSDSSEDEFETTYESEEVSVETVADEEESTTTSTVDSDGDEVSDEEETANGTDPEDASSY